MRGCSRPPRTPGTGGGGGSRVSSPGTGTVPWTSPKPGSALGPFLRVFPVLAFILRDPGTLAEINRSCLSCGVPCMGTPLLHVVTNQCHTGRSPAPLGAGGGWGGCRHSRTAGLCHPIPTCSQPGCRSLCSTSPHAPAAADPPAPIALPARPISGTFSPDIRFPQPGNTTASLDPWLPDERVQWLRGVCLWLGGGVRWAITYGVKIRFPEPAVAPPSPAALSLDPHC